MKAVVAALAVAAVGCAPPPDVLSLRISASMPDDDIEQALQVAHEWEVESGCRYEPVIITDVGCSTQDCQYVDEVAPGQLLDGWAELPNSCGDATHGLGCTMVTPDTWQVHTRIANNLRSREPTAGTGTELVHLTLLHEFGHGLGLSHVKPGSVPSVMVPGVVEMARHIEPEDVWQYNHVRGRQ